MNITISSTPSLSEPALRFSVIGRHIRVERHGDDLSITSTGGGHGQGVKEMVDTDRNAREEEVSQDEEGSPQA